MNWGLFGMIAKNKLGESIELDNGLLTISSNPNLADIDLNEMNQEDVQRIIVGLQYFHNSMSKRPAGL
jgi:hypothetical protein